MNKSSECVHPTTIDKLWPYEQYYTGEKDSKNRKSNNGDHHWTGAESLESYTGHFVRDTMHGLGEYRWRYKGPEGTFATYEGNFYGNNMHGYGTMSYDDGRTFTGLFHHNLRWGPGVESQACLREDVGFWRGNQLMRLTWRPAAPSVALDIGFSIPGRTRIEPFRKLLVARKEKLGKVNSALELLKQYGTEPMQAIETWHKLYPKHCNDFASQLCDVKYFDSQYYDQKMQYLEEVTDTPTAVEEDLSDASETEPSTTYYAWNNTKTYIHMMKHCYKHEKQRKKFNLKLAKVLNGPRHDFKPAGKHELDCRVLLMSSYLGHIVNVAQMVNVSNVHPEVTDMQGNNAIMYATCGDRPDIIHFLKEAGTTVDAFNDNCCTPLSLALIRYACIRRDITENSMVQALIPPPLLPAQASQIPTEDKPSEWFISRDFPTVSPPNTMRASKMSPRPVRGRSQSSHMGLSKKSEADIETNQSTQTFGEKDLSFEEKRLFINVNGEFTSRVNDLFSKPTALNPLPYLFAVNDMVLQLLTYLDESKRGALNHRKAEEHKVIKPSTDSVWQASKDEFGSIDTVEKFKQEVLSRIMLTILQLLTDGADPRLVKCPQPAVLMAVISNSASLVEHFANRGADINEVYPDLLDYTPLDVALSQIPAAETLELVKTLLRCGARTDHCLKYDDPEVLEPPISKRLGPNLLHVLLAKECNTNVEEDIRNQMIELLLKYNCDPIQMFKGSSALDMAMNKGMDILDIFIKSPKTNLNAIINESNQTVLTKMFWLPFSCSIPAHQRLLTLTNLLLYGADPLLECQNGADKYQNVFVFARKTHLNMGAGVINLDAGTDAGAAVKKPDKAKKDEKPKNQSKLYSTAKLHIEDIIGDYKQALDLAVDCARILLVRWLQTKLYNELMDVIIKYKHRQWNMIYPEHKNKKSCALWLTSVRCIEIWEILKTKKRKGVDDRRILKHLLCIVQLYCDRGTSFLGRKVTTEERGTVETEVNRFLYEHKTAQSMDPEEVSCSRPYVLPELCLGSEEKYNVCFECLLPFEENKIQCQYCKLISFCSYDCMKINIDRAGCHPCSERLKVKYFPTPEESTVSIGSPSKSKHSAIKQQPL